MNKIKIVLLAALMIFFAESHLYAEAPGNKERALAATEGLSSFVKKIPPGAQSGYGFASIEEIESATLGTPYQTHIVYIDDKGLEKLEPLEEWRFPVLVGTSQRALLTVAIVDGSWNAVDFGAASLARDIQTVELKSLNKGESKTKSIVRNHILKVDFLAFSDTAVMTQAAFVPLASAKKLISTPPVQSVPQNQSLFPTPKKSADSPLTYGEMISVIREGLKK